MPKGVYERTEEMKRKTSEGVKRLWENKEYREKVSNSHSHKLDKDWKKNISKGMKGKKKSALYLSLLFLDQCKIVGYTI